MKIGRIIGLSVKAIVANNTISIIIEEIEEWIIAYLYGAGSLVETLPAFVEKVVGAIWFLPALFSFVIVRYCMEV